MPDGRHLACVGQFVDLSAENLCLGSFDLMRVELLLDGRQLRFPLGVSMSTVFPSITSITFTAIVYCAADLVTNMNIEKHART